MNPILSTGGHEQDIKAMLELYDNLIERDEPQNDQETTRNDQETPKLPRVNPKTAKKLLRTTKKTTYK